MPDAAAVYFPRPSTAKLNTPPHMIEVQRPHNIMKIILSGTFVNKNGIVTVVVTGVKIASKIKNKPTEDTTINIVLLETLEPIAQPVRRPTNISNQYIPTILPAIVASIPEPAFEAEV